LGSSRVADDFTVPAGQVWNLSKLNFYAVVLPPAPATSPITAVRVVIRSASPVGASTVLFGDLTTNRLSATSFSNIYTIANSQVPAPGTVPNQNFVVWKVEADVATTLNAGTYWIEWQIVGAPGQRVFALMSQPVGARTAPGYNGVGTFNNGPWTPTIDNGTNGASPVPVDYVFDVNYSQTGICVTPTIPTISGNTNTCAGAPTTLSIPRAGGILNSATNWFWYSGSCGGTPVGTGSSITVSPLVPTTYYVRGEGACFPAGACASVTVNALTGSTAAVLSQVQIPTGTVNLINEQFDGTIPPAGWPVQNLSNPIGLTGWSQTNSLVFPPQSGVGFASANFNNTAGTGTISNWMFTPNVTLKNGDKFSFWTRTTTGTFPDRLQLRQSTNGTSVNVGTTDASVGDFSTLLLDINPNLTATGYPTAWTQFTVTIAGVPAAGISGRLAFRYFVTGGGPTGANSDFIGIDNAVYSTATFSNPTTCANSNANLKVDITGGLAPYTVVINTVPATTPITVTNYNSGDPIQVSPAATTTYTLVSVTSAAGCVGTGNSGTPTITVGAGPMPSLAITAVPNGTICAGDPVLLTVVVPAAVVSTFSNPASIAIPSSGTGTPYPSNINVTGLPATGVTVQNVRLNNMSHTWGNDVDILLQSPLGQNVVLMSDVGGTAPIAATYTFNDAGPAMNTGGANPTGTYRPTNNDVADNWPAPGPGAFAQAAPALSLFGNTANFNGAWKLFVVDDTGGDLGSIAGGYSIDFQLPSIGGTISTVSWSPTTGLSSGTSNPVAAAPASTTTYTAFVTAGNGCQGTVQRTINVNQLPAVTQQPVNVTACQGSTVTFTGAGSGAGFTYQWQESVNAGVTYTDLANGGVYSGVTTATLTITGVPASFNNNRYRLKVNGTCLPSANSVGAILTVNPLPAITVAPAGAQCGGVPGVSGLLLTASGAGNYIWTPATGLFTNPTATIPYVAGTPTATVYAAPSAFTIYTVSGTNATTGCVGSTNVIVNYTPPAPNITPSSVVTCLGYPAVKLISSTSTTSTNTYTNSTATPILDNTPAGTTSAITVSNIPTGAVVTGMKVTLNATHTWIGDVVFALKAPNGSALNLDYFITGLGSQGSGGFSNTAFTSVAGAPALSSGTGLFTGTFRPDAAGAASVPAPGPAGFSTTYVGNFAGLYSTPNGTYTLGMADYFGGDFGSLSSWTLEITYVVGVPATPAIWSPTTGLFHDSLTTIPYLGTPRDTVWVKRSTSGVYPYTATVQSTPIPDPSNPASITIPSVGTGTPYPSPINISGYPTTGVSVQSVTLNGVSHTWGNDVDILLQSPTGQNVVLMSDIGGTVAIPNANYTFNDASPAMSITAANPTGSYRPTNNDVADNWPAPGPGAFAQAAPALSLFGNTANVNGAWKLFVVDDTGGDLGSISGGWSIKFSYAFPACTSPARTVVVTVNDSIKFNPLLPADAAVCTDKVTSFTTAATGTNIQHNWKVSTDNGNIGTWSPVVNGGVYAGANTATLTITAPPLSMNGYMYKDSIHTTGCKDSVSRIAKLTVNPLPTITLSASAPRIFPGLTSTISSTVSPIGSTFTWFRNGIQVPGSTGTLVVNADGLGDYRLRVTDVNGCTNTSGIITIADSASGRVFIYPNPNTGLFQVRYYSSVNTIAPRGVNVYDARGKRVFTQVYPVSAPYSRMDVNLSNHGSGLYMIEVVDVDGNRLAIGKVDVLR
jgi:subtilisin-like proprotein convertase family protein